MTMKLRNRLIALVCLVLFLTLGAGLFLTSSARKPFAVILFVSDNLEPSALAAARIFGGGGDSRLQMEDFPNLALCRNPANDYSVPDAASASTEIATGCRGNRGSLGIAADGSRPPSLLELAASAGRSTGLVSAGDLASPTAAAFYARTPDAGNRADVVSQLFARPPFDLTAGLWTNDTPSPTKDSFHGASLVRSLPELEARPFWKRDPVVALLPSSSLSGNPSGGGDPSRANLSDLVRTAILTLQSNRKGYLLVVDDPVVAAKAAANDGEAMLGEILSLDKAVATARRYAGENSLILVCGRGSVGGLRLNGYPFLRDKGISVLSLNNDGYPSLSWSTGPGYGIEPESSPKGRTNAGDQAGILSQPAATRLPAAVGTAGDVLCVGEGAGSENLRGFLDLGAVNGILRKAL